MATFGFRQVSGGSSPVDIAALTGQAGSYFNKAISGANTALEKKQAGATNKVANEIAGLDTLDQHTAFKSKLNQGLENRTGADLGQLLGKFKEQRGTALNNTKDAFLADEQVTFDNALTQNKNAFTGAIGNLDPNAQQYVNVGKSGNIEFLGNTPEAVDAHNTFKEAAQANGYTAPETAVQQRRETMQKLLGQGFTQAEAADTVTVNESARRALTQLDPESQQRLSSTLGAFDSQAEQEINLANTLYQDTLKTSPYSEPALEAVGKHSTIKDFVKAEYADNNWQWSSDRASGDDLVRQARELVDENHSEADVIAAMATYGQINGDWMGIYNPIVDLAAVRKHLANNTTSDPEKTLLRRAGEHRAYFDKINNIRSRASAQKAAATTAASREFGIQDTAENARRLDGVLARFQQKAAPDSPPVPGTSSAANTNTNVPKKRTEAEVIDSLRKQVQGRPNGNTDDNFAVRATNSVLDSLNRGQLARISEDKKATIENALSDGLTVNQIAKRYPDINRTQANVVQAAIDRANTSRKQAPNLEGSTGRGSTGGLTPEETTLPTPAPVAPVRGKTVLGNKEVSNDVINKAVKAIQAGASREDVRSVARLTPQQFDDLIQRYL